MKNRTEFKAALLQGISQTDKSEKTNNILGRSTLIHKPLSIVEEQFSDLQKSKKYTSNIIVNNSLNKKNEKKNVLKLDSIKNSSLNIYPTHKSLKKDCSKVIKNQNFVFNFYNWKSAMKKKLLRKSFS